MQWRGCLLFLPLLLVLAAGEGEDGWLVSQLYDRTDCGGPVLEESGRPVKLALCTPSPCGPVLGSSYSSPDSLAIGQRLVCTASAPVDNTLVNRFYKFGEAFTAFPRGCSLHDGGRRSFDLKCMDANSSDPYSGYWAEQVFYEDTVCGEELSRTPIVPRQDARSWTVFCADASHLSMHLALTLLLLTLVAAH